MKRLTLPRAWMLITCLALMLPATGANAQEAERPLLERLDKIEKRLERIEQQLVAPAAARSQVLRARMADLPKRALVSEAGEMPPVTGDADDDGLNDDEEATVGTDPNNPDTDGDALLDGWEVHGVNRIDLSVLGASPLHKDVFVEMDYMARASAANGLGPNDHVLDVVRQVFAAAPLSNPDGTGGINIHLDLGNEVPHDPDLSPVVLEFDAIKQVHFDPPRAPVFHYMLWADRYNGGTSSGNAFAIPNSDFIVTLGGWNGGQGGTDQQKIGTFIHELGHNLGLKHGGSEHTGYKPNHLSVMNYSFQTRGILHHGGRRLDYQRFPVPSLDEDVLLEEYGLGGSPALGGYHTIIRDGFSIREVSADGAIDWNDNGHVDTLPVTRDINGDNFFSELLATPDEWAGIIYNGGTIGSTGSIDRGLKALADRRRLLPFVELTEEMDKALRNP